MEPPLDYMGECQVFDGIRSDIYNLCQFYVLGMTADLPEFPVPWQPVTHGQIRDVLKSAHSISQPYLILAHSTNSVTAVSMLRELHTAACLRHLQVDLRDKSIKLLFCLFCTYAGGNDLSYLNHIIIAHYNTSYGCGKCLKQAFVSSPRSQPQALTASPAAEEEAMATMVILPGPLPRRGTPRLLPQIPRAPVPHLPRRHHHATVDERRPATTSPTRT